MDALQEDQMDSQDVFKSKGAGEMGADLQGLAPVVLPGLTTGAAGGAPAGRDDDAARMRARGPAPGSLMIHQQAQRQQHEARPDDQQDQPQPRRVRQAAHLGKAAPAAAAGAAGNSKAAVEAAMAARGMAPGTVYISAADADDTDGTADSHGAGSIGASGGGPAPTGSAGAGGQVRTRSNAFDTSSLDPRRAKRILANRQSAQRSRMKRLQHVHQLENQASELATQVLQLQSKLSNETRRADEASAAAESAAKTVALLQQQVDAQMALAASLQQQLAMLGGQAAAAGILGQVQQHAHPLQHSHHRQQQQQQQPQPRQHSTQLATSGVSALLQGLQAPAFLVPVIANPGTIAARAPAVGVLPTQQAPLPRHPHTMLPHQPQQQLLAQQPQTQSHADQAPMLRPLVSPGGLLHITIPQAATHAMPVAGPLSPRGGNRVCSTVAPGVTGPTDAPGGGPSLAPGPASAAAGELASPVDREMEGGYEALLGDDGLEAEFDGDTDWPPQTWTSS